MSVWRVTSVKRVTSAKRLMSVKSVTSARKLMRWGGGVCGRFHRVVWKNSLTMRRVGCR